MSDTCIICGHELRNEETQSCIRCVGRVRRDLWRIADLFALLPAVIHAGYSTNTALGQPHGTDDTPLLGGLALLLSTRGTVGTAGADSTSDEWDSDPAPVLAVLESWVRDWAEIRDEQLPSSAATISSETGYLIRLAGWAGEHHPAFNEFTREISALRRRLETVTATDARPLQAPASCFDCDGPLVRDWTATGLADDWRCQHCKREYAPTEYWLAVRAALEEAS